MCFTINCSPYYTKEEQERMCRPGLDRLSAFLDKKAAPNAEDVTLADIKEVVPIGWNPNDHRIPITDDGMDNFFAYGGAIETASDLFDLLSRCSHGQNHNTLRQRAKNDDFRYKRMVCEEVIIVQHILFLYLPVMVDEFEQTKNEDLEFTTKMAHIYIVFDDYGRQLLVDHKSRNAIQTMFNCTQSLVERKLREKGESIKDLRAQLNFDRELDRIGDLPTGSSHYANIVINEKDDLSVLYHLVRERPHVGSRFLTNEISEVKS